MKFRRAEEGDAEQIVGLLRDGKALLRERGIDQWQNDAFDGEEIRGWIGRGEAFVVTEGDAIAGVCTIVGREPDYDKIDGSWSREEYLAVHRVAVSRDFLRRGVTAEIYAGAEQRARTCGAHALRADTHRENAPMRNALLKNGFSERGTVRVGTQERIAYEKILEDEMKTTVVAATGNAHKLAEFREILRDATVISAAEAGFCGEVEETGSSFAENAEIKARAVCQATKLPALADDSGLCVEALGGAPGIYSARYSGGGDAENRRLLLKNLEDQTDRRAYFACAVALAYPDGRVICAEGRTYGKILTEERGRNGFGYDCLFYSDDLQKSFGEASEEEKNAVSHRGRALRALEEKL